MSSPQAYIIPANGCALARAVILDPRCQTFRFFAAGAEVSSAVLNPTLRGSNRQHRSNSKGDGDLDYIPLCGGEA